MPLTDFLIVSGIYTGCARVPGDEEEDGVDDLENEFNWIDRHDIQSVAESMFHGHMSYGRGSDMPFQPNPNVPLLTDGQMVLAILFCHCCFTDTE